MQFRAVVTSVSVDESLLGFSLHFYGLFPLEFSWEKETFSCWLILILHEEVFIRELWSGEGNASSQ